MTIDSDSTARTAGLIRLRFEQQMKIPAPGGDDDGGGEATAGDGAGEFTRGMFVCMLRVVGSYTKINTKWFRKKLAGLIGFTMRRLIIA